MICEKYWVEQCSARYRVVGRYRVLWILLIIPKVFVVILVVVVVLLILVVIRSGYDGGILYEGRIGTLPLLREGGMRTISTGSYWCLEMLWNYEHKPAYIVLPRKMDHVYSLLKRYGATTRERLFLSVLNRFLSVLDHISPSQIDSMVNQFQSVIVRYVYNFGTI